MVREIMLYTSNDLRDFMHLACASPLDIGVHTMDNQIADGKSVLGLMAIDSVSYTHLTLPTNSLV